MKHLAWYPHSCDWLMNHIGPWTGGEAFVGLNLAAVLMVVYGWALLSVVWHRWRSRKDYRG